MAAIPTPEAWEGDGQQPNSPISEFAKSWNEEIVLGSPSQFMRNTGLHLAGLGATLRSSSNPDITSTQPHIPADSDPHTPNSDTMAGRLTPKGWSSQVPKGEYDMVNGGRLPDGVHNLVSSCQIPPECIETRLANRQKHFGGYANWDSNKPAEYHPKAFMPRGGRGPQHTSYQSQYAFEHATLGDFVDPTQYAADSVGTFRSGASEHDEFFSPRFANHPHLNVAHGQIANPFDQRAPPNNPYAPANGKNAYHEMQAKQVQLNYIQKKYLRSQMRHQESFAELQKMQKKNIDGIKKIYQRGMRDQESEHDKAVAALQKEHEHSKAKLQKKHDAESKSIRNDIDSLIRELSAVKKEVKVLSTPPLQQEGFQTAVTRAKPSTRPQPGQQNFKANGYFATADQRHDDGKTQAYPIRTVSRVEDRPDKRPGADGPIKRNSHANAEEQMRPELRGGATPSPLAGGELTPPSPQQFNVTPNPHDDVFNGNAPAFGPVTPGSQQKPIGVLLSSALKKIESIVRGLPIVLIDSKQKPQFRYIINAAQRLLTNQKMPYEFFRDGENRKYLMIGIISQEIVKEVFEDPILDKFASAHTERFCKAWQAEFDAITQGHGEDLKYRHTLAVDRAHAAFAITHVPGFWKRIQQYGYEVTERIAERISSAFWQFHGDPLRKGLWSAVDDCLRIAVRMRQEAYITDFFFPKLGVSWNGDYMVHRNPETMGKDLDNEKAVHLVRITMLPLVKQKQGFSENIADPTVLHKAEVLVDSRDCGLRAARHC